MWAAASDDNEQKQWDLIRRDAPCQEAEKGL